MANFLIILVALVFVQGCFALSHDAKPSPNPLISHGESAVAGQLPHYASVMLKLPLIAPVFRCGGSILNERWVLTSGQCNVLRIKPIGAILQVRAGQQCRGHKGEYVQTRDVLLVIVNRGLTSGLGSFIKQNDIALLKLNEPLKLNARVQPVALPKMGEFPNGDAILSGFGASSVGLLPQYPGVLQWANVTILTQSDCEDAIVTVSAMNRGRLTTKHVCTGPLDRPVTACVGDAGDPLVQQVGKKPAVLIGILSWAPPTCGMTGSPVVYTRVSAFNDWIEKRIIEN